jgi:D-alanyl-D-alanine carboxypeptidase (penicillin-binding protein 5/6)
MEARASESQKLLNWGFQAFDTVRLFDDAQVLATAEVWKGMTRSAKLGAAAGVFVTVPKGDAARLKTRIERNEPLLAPLTKGQRVGTIKVTTPSGQAVVDVPLVVLEPVEAAGLMGRVWDTIRLWIR